MNFPAEPRSLFRELISWSFSRSAVNLNGHGSSASTAATAASTSVATVEAALTCSFHPCAAGSSAVSGAAGRTVHQRPLTVNPHPPSPPLAPVPVMAARATSTNVPSASGASSTDLGPPAMRSGVPAPI